MAYNFEKKKLWALKRNAWEPPTQKVKKFLPALCGESHGQFGQVFAPKKMPKVAFWPIFWPIWLTFVPGQKNPGQTSKKKVFFNRGVLAIRGSLDITLQTSHRRFLDSKVGNSQGTHCPHAFDEPGGVPV